MLELVLTRGGKKLLRKPLNDAPVTIGRATGNALVLLDPEISRRHCRLEWRGEALHLVDLSKNGTLVNGELSRATAIGEGDHIAVGPWTLSIESAAEGTPARTVACAPCATKVVHYDAVERRLTTEALEVTVQSPGQAPISKKFSAGEVTLGQHAACDIVVVDPFVSRRHCQIVNAAGSLALVDLTSTNGTFVGSTRISQSSLPASGSFRIGQSAVAYRLLRRAERIAASKEGQLGRLVGPSQAMREIFALVEKVAPSEATVCITGESGTGKELVARELHERSPRRRGPFVAVNCGALPASLIESQLFGHERGSFTGATERMQGLFEQARGGTLFLDEIGEMPLELQTRLLRVLEGRTLRRVGGEAEIPVDARIVCATNSDLKAMVRDRCFREDLFFRIYLVPLEIPPLRRRPEDIAALAQHFLRELAERGRHAHLTDAAVERLLHHAWPGNVRELKNTLERTLLLTPHDAIDAGDLRIESVGGCTIGESDLRGKERAILVAAIEESSGNLSRASRKLGIARTTLQKKIKRHAIDVPRPTPADGEKDTHPAGQS